VSVDIQAYDPSWPAGAEAAVGELTAALPGLFSAIEHIGSTSVPGLAAKPIVDLMAATADLEGVRARDADLAALGYQRAGTGMPNRLLYARGQQGRRSHHLHVVLAESWDTRNERLLRDHLRAHPADALRYAALKQRLAGTRGSDDDYTRGKTALIQELTDRARAVRGLPSVPVWEE
jgi:GrpB-like predicted nucleotidyltransferase (UPF0157 family)